MTGTEERGADGDRLPPSSEAGKLAIDELRALVEAERAAARHWRKLAVDRAAALDGLKRRPLVRVVLGVDRRLDPLRRAGAGGAGRARTAGSRFAVAVAGLRSTAVMPSRKQALEAALAALPAPPAERRTVCVVPLGGRSPELGRAGPVPVAEVGTDAPDRTRPASRRPSVVDAATLRSCRGDLVCLLGAATEPLSDGWLARLAVAINGDTVAATPTVLHPRRPPGSRTAHDLLVRHRGVDVVAAGAGAPEAVARGAGGPVDVTAGDEVVSAGTAACLVVDRRAFEAVGGLRDAGDPDVAVMDLCARLRRAGGAVVNVAQSLVVDHRVVPSRDALVRPVDQRGLEWRALVERQGASLLRRGERPAARFAITVASPSAKVASRWGDFHLAEALAESLRRLGHPTLVQTADQADSPAGRACDVHVVLRGLARVRRTSGQRHVIWVISHPEAVDDDECDAADLVLVASERFAEHLGGRTSTPVGVLLQATDHHRFRPCTTDPRHAHDVTVVAKSRDVMRPMVADALEAGLRPAIYGSGWEGLVDPGLVVADHVPNEELPVVYSSAGVVLNDHWDTMRTWGFVSNRIFDVAACATPVISDHLPEIADLFGGLVPTWQSPPSLAREVAEVLADPAAAGRRAADLRRLVVERHTFDHRAAELIAHLGAAGIVEPLP